MILKKLLVAFLISFLPFLKVYSQEKKFQIMLSSWLKNTVPQLKANELAGWLNQQEEFILLDSREAAEFQTSHLPGALWVGYLQLDEKTLDNLPKNKKIVVYCTVGVRSEKIGERLQKKGCLQVYNLYGGIIDWANGGHPLKDKEGKETQKVHTYDASWGKWLKKGIKVH